MNQVSSPIADIRWVQFNNNTGGAIPAFAVMVPTGIDAGGNLQMGQPTADGQAGCYFNGPLDVPSGSWGVCTRDLPTHAAYAGGTPSVGQYWQAKNGLWTLGSGGSQGTGYRILAPGASGRVLLDQPAGSSGGGSGSSSAFEVAGAQLSVGAYSLPDSTTTLLPWTGAALYSTLPGLLSIDVSGSLKFGPIGRYQINLSASFELNTTPAAGSALGVIGGDNSIPPFCVSSATTLAQPTNPSAGFNYQEVSTSYCLITQSVNYVHNIFVAQNTGVTLSGAGGLTLLYSP